MNEVAQAAAAGFDGGVERGFDDRHQPPKAFTRDFSRRRARVDACAKQAFRSIDIADADNAMAVHQHRFDGCREAAEGAFQPGGVEHVVQRLDAQMRQQRVRQDIAFQPQHGAEAARITQAQRRAAEDQVNVIVFLRGFASGYQPQAARHAQMNQQMPAAEIQQQIFAASRNGAQMPADKGGTLRMGQGITQRRYAKVGAGETAADECGRNAAPSDFNFRQFRHAGNGAKLITSPHCMRLFYPGTLPMNPVPRPAVRRAVQRAVQQMVLALLFAGGAALAQTPDAAEPVANDERLPKQELTAKILYEFLLAEIAGQRGQMAIASDVYFDLAKNTRDPRIVRRAAEVAFYARQYNTALEAARMWVVLEPQAREAQQMLATLLLASGRIDELAANMARELENAGPRTGDLLLQHQRAFAAYPDKAAVRRLFDQLTAPYPALPEAHLVRAQAALGVSDTAGAMAEIDKALELRPSWELAALFKASLLPRGEPQLDFLRRFLAANPRAHDVRLGYARVLVAEKRYDAARGEFQTLLKVSPDSPDVLFAVGILSLQLNDVAEAEQQLRRFIAIGRGELDAARFYLGQIAEQAGRTDEALDWYRAVAAGEQLVPAHVRAAQMLVQQNKLDEAREQLAAARVAAPNDNRLLIAEAQLLREAGHHAEAYALLKPALEAQPDDPELLYETALSAEKLDYVDVMERHLRRLMKIKPDSAHAYNALGYSLADRNVRLHEAMQLLDKALALAPDDPFILDSKGWALFRQGNAAAALEFLQKAYARKPDAEIAAHAGEVMWTLGQHDEAMKLWRDAAQAHPDNEALTATIKRFAP